MSCKFTLIVASRWPATFNELVRQHLQLSRKKKSVGSSLAKDLQIERAALSKEEQ